MSEDPRQMAIVEEEGAGLFPAVITTPDATLVAWFGEMDAKIAGIVEDAESYVVEADEIGVKAANEKIRECRALGKEAIDGIKPYKDRLNELKGQVMAAEHHYVDPTKKAEDIYARKRDEALDKIEAAAKAEAERIAKLAQAEQEKRLKAINARLDKLLEKTEDLTAQKANLEAALQDSEITEEEAAIIRQRIGKIETQLAGAQSKVDEKQSELEQTAAPIAVAVETPKIGGMSSGKRWVAERIAQPKLLLQAIIQGKVPMSSVKFVASEIEKFANMQQVKGSGAAPTIPGVIFRQERATRVMGGR